MRSMSYVPFDGRNGLVHELPAHPSTTMPSAFIFLCRLLRSILSASAVLDTFQPFSLSFAVMKSLSNAARASLSEPYESKSHRRHRRVRVAEPA